VLSLSTPLIDLGEVPREQKMLKGHLPRVIYHQVYWYMTKTLNPQHEWQLLLGRGAEPLFTDPFSGSGGYADCLETDCLRADCLRADRLRDDGPRADCLRADCLRDDWPRADCLRADCLRADCLRADCLSA